MARLAWDTAGTRFYETGVDQGVLYPAAGDGIAWSGLVSVNEEPTGGDPKPFYFDGLKYLNLAAAEEFEATITAFSAPPEFAACDGTLSVQNGLFATQQPRTAFGFSYRVKVGNDDLGDAYGYKIHLVYNALSAPPSRDNKTVESSAEAMSLAWPITTLPPSLTGYKPTAHLVIDSRYTKPNLLAALEDILYGSASLAPRLPSPNELVAIYTSGGPLKRTNQNTNPAYRSLTTALETRRNLALNPAYRSTTALSNIRTNLFMNPTCTVDAAQWTQVNQSAGTTTGARQTSGGMAGVFATFYRQTWTAVTTGALSSTGVVFGNPNADNILGPFVPGSTIYLSVYAKSNHVGRTASLVLTFHDAAGVQNAFTLTSTAVDISAGWTRLSVTGVVPAACTRGYSRVYAVGGTVWAVNDTLDVGGVLCEHSKSLMFYFDGDNTPDDATLGLNYVWAGTAGASLSYAQAPLKTYASCFQGYTRNNWTMVGGATDGSNTNRCYIAVMGLTQPLLLFSTDQPPGAAGDVASARFRIRQVPGTAINDIVITANLYAYTAASAAISAMKTITNINVPLNGTWVDVLLPGSVAPTNTGQFRLYVQITSAFDVNTGVIETSNVLIEKGGGPRSYFDGATTDTPTFDYSWLGAADTTFALAKTPFPTGWQTSISPLGSGQFWCDPGTGTNAYLWCGGLATYVLARTPPVAAIGKDSPGCHVYTRVTADVDTTINTWAEFGTGAGGRVMFSYPLLAGVPFVIDQVYVNNLAPGAGTTASWYIGWHPPVAIPALPVTLTIEPVLIADLGDVGGYFDGSSPDVDDNWYSWSGAADASSSLLNTWN